MNMLHCNEVMAGKSLTCRQSRLPPVALAPALSSTMVFALASILTNAMMMIMVMDVLFCTLFPALKVGSVRRVVGSRNGLLTVGSKLIQRRRYPHDVMRLDESTRGRHVIRRSPGTRSVPALLRCIFAIEQS